MWCTAGKQAAYMAAEIRARQLRSPLSIGGSIQRLESQAGDRWEVVSDVTSGKPLTHHLPDITSKSVLGGAGGISAGSYSAGEKLSRAACVCHCRDRRGG